MDRVAYRTWYEAACPESPSSPGAVQDKMTFPVKPIAADKFVTAAGGTASADAAFCFPDADDYVLRGLSASWTVMVADESFAGTANFERVSARYYRYDDPFYDPYYDPFHHHSGTHWHVGVGVSSSH